MDESKTYYCVIKSRNPTKLREDYLQGLPASDRYSWVLTLVKTKNSHAFGVAMATIGIDGEKRSAVTSDTLIKREDILGFLTVPVKIFEPTNRDIFVYYGDDDYEEVEKKINEWKTNLTTID